MQYCNSGQFIKIRFTRLGISTFLPCRVQAKKGEIWISAFLEFLKSLRGGGGKWQPFLEPWNHTPPKYGARNSQISQMVLEGQDGYQTVRLVFLINLIYLYIDRKGLKLRRLWFQRLQFSSQTHEMMLMVIKFGLNDDRQAIAVVIQP